MVNETGNGTSALTVYDKVEPLEFINQMGKVFALSGAGGCATEADGKLMALACLCERKTIFEIARRYHLMAGKLVLKAETMLGDFRRAGGTHRWVNDGDDGRAATLELTDPKGNVGSTTFTIEKATAAGYVKAGSQWLKRPDQMLRSRCITDGIRKLCPEISSGEFVEEEVTDFAPDVKPAAPAATATAIRKTAPAATGTAAGTATVTTVAATQPVAVAAETIIDVQPEPVQTAEQPPFDTSCSTEAGDVGSISQTAVLLEIEATIKQAGVTVERVLTALNTKGGTSYTKLDDLPAEKSLALLENLRAIIAKQQNPGVPY